MNKIIDTMDEFIRRMGDGECVYIPITNDVVRQLPVGLVKDLLEAELVYSCRAKELNDFNPIMAERNLYNT